MQVQQGLAANFEFFNQTLVSLFVLLLQVIQQAAPLVDHFNQAKSGAVIFLVDFKVLGEHLNAFRKQRDLNIGCFCIAALSI